MLSFVKEITLRKAHELPRCYLPASGVRNSICLQLVGPTSVKTASRPLVFFGFAKAISSLSENPERLSQSRERNRFAYEIRDLPFGLGRRPTHRAVFTIRGDEVVVLTVRHVAQRDISPDDIAV